MMSLSMIASLFLFTSCKKENMEEEYEEEMAADTMMAVAPLGFRGSDTLVTEYPTLIDEYLATNYPDAELLGVSTDGIEYEVELANGTTLVFDLDGNLLKEELPEMTEEEEEDTDSLVIEWPAAIDDYVLLNYPNDTILEVYYEDGEYEVELSSDIELLFDLDGNFLEAEENTEVSEWPAAIDEYLALNYPDAQIDKVELEDEEYEVELDSGTELLFDLDGNFLEEELDKKGN